MACDAYTRCDAIMSIKNDRRGSFAIVLSLSCACRCLVGCSLFLFVGQTKSDGMAWKESIVHFIFSNLPFPRVRVRWDCQNANVESWDFP